MDISFLRDTRRKVERGRGREEEGERGKHASRKRSYGEGERGGKFR